MAVSLKSLTSKQAKKLKAKGGQARCLVDFTAGLAREFSAQDGSLGEHRCEAMATLAELVSLAKQLELSSRDMSSLEAAGCFTHVTLCALWVSNLPRVSLVFCSCQSTRSAEAFRRFLGCTATNPRTRGQTNLASLLERLVCVQVLLRLQWNGALHACIFFQRPASRVTLVVHRRIVHAKCPDMFYLCLPQMSPYVDLDLACVSL